MYKTHIMALCTAILPGVAAADCATDDQVAAYVESFRTRTPAKALGADGTMDDALCTQGKVVQILTETLGPVVGYKAGLTSAPAQQRFGVAEPVQGVLYRDMFLKSGAELPLTFGAVPMVEADLVLVVGDAGINGATTPAEVMEHVSEVRPFIELPDLMVAKGEPLTGITITAGGVGARAGILGDPVPVADPVSMTKALETMTVTMRTATGEVLAEAPGKAVLDHPANAVLWLLSKGVELQPGEMVSVGSFGPLIPPMKTGGAVTVSYRGLPGDPEIGASFR
ncbi:2-keto-4-pentenoate hydratase [Chachezhania sediminis]|uniref:2-keto-4-pentenoate hydratase n=1 Tax=Chachezhania sediminis TaxID=2599291 RepID=UPI00131D4752|nr:hydratase [Chachezhania sediminis]